MVPSGRSRNRVETSANLGSYRINAVRTHLGVILARLQAPASWVEVLFILLDGQEFLRFGVDALDRNNVVSSSSPLSDQGMVMYIKQAHD